MCGTSAINSLVLPKEKMKDMDKIRTGLAAFGMSGILGQESRRHPGKLQPDCR